VRYTLDDLDHYIITDPAGDLHLGIVAMADAGSNGLSARFIVDGKVHGTARGCGYSLSGTCMADWLEYAAQDRLAALVPGVTYTYRAIRRTPRSKPTWDLASVDRNDSAWPNPLGVVSGLMHHAYPTSAGVAIVSSIDGAIGASTVMDIARACGYQIKWVPCTSATPLVPIDRVPEARI